MRHSKSKNIQLQMYIYLEAFGMWRKKLLEIDLRDQSYIGFSVNN